jgi:hypothetical protein
VDLVEHAEGREHLPDAELEQVGEGVLDEAVLHRHVAAAVLGRDAVLERHVQGRPHALAGVDVQDEVEAVRVEGAVRIAVPLLAEPLLELEAGVPVDANPVEEVLRRCFGCQAGADQERRGEAARLAVHRLPPEGAIPTVRRHLRDAGV